MRNQQMLQTGLHYRPLGRREPRMAAVTLEVFELAEADREEALKFLSARPVHTVVMASFINDNGISNERNRGKFYGYRNAEGRLEGVALIGHSTLIEARSDAALRGFAARAKTSETPIHLIMSHGNSAQTFWHLYSGGLSEPRLVCVERLFEVAFPLMVRKAAAEIRPATAEELVPVAEAQAEVAFMECGVDPMVKDREGFLKRVLRRIEQGRVFVAVEDGKLVFKADVIAETPETAYLEGVYVAPQFRGKGVGSECLHQVAVELLNRVANVCLLSNVEFEKAHNSFFRAGFKAADECTTIFV